MIKIRIGEPCENDLYFVDSYFEYFLRDNVIESEFAKKAIKEIDKSEVLGNNAIKSPYLGIISKDELSTGTKSMIVLYETNQIISMDHFGDNCFNILQLAADMKEQENRGDVLITCNQLRNLFCGGNNYNGIREAYVINTNTIIRCFEEWFREYCKSI